MPVDRELVHLINYLSFYKINCLKTLMQYNMKGYVMLNYTNANFNTTISTIYYNLTTIFYDNMKFIYKKIIQFC